MSVEEKIEEALISFMIYLSSVLDPSIVGDKISKIESKFQELKEQILSYVSSLSESAELQEDINYLKQEISNLQKEKSELEKQIVALKQQIEEISSEKEKISKEKEELESENAELKQKIEELKSEIEKLSEENESLKYDYNQAIRARDEAEKKLEELKKELEHALQKKESVEVSLQSLDADLRWASSRLRDEIVSDISALREQIRNQMYELRGLIPPRVRPKIERIGMLVNQIYSKIRARDFGASLIRLLNERRKTTKK